MSPYILVFLATVPLGVAALAMRSPAIAAASFAALVASHAMGVVFPQLNFYGRSLCRGPSTRRWVALTFDDGPDPKATPALLDLLRERGVQAAFFGVGHRVEAHPDLAARIVREGHLLENHSFWHSSLTNLYTEGRLRRELERTQETIRAVTGVSPSSFRPPMGLTNPRIFRVARALGLWVVGWSARGLDTKHTDPDRIVQRIARRLHPGAIILLHDGGIPSDRLVLTVKRLLDTLRDRQYEVVRLDRMQQ